MQAKLNLDEVRASRLKSVQRIVIKLGTNTVTGDDGAVCAERVGPIVQSVAGLMRSGRQVVLVSSGAVGLGRALLGLHHSRLRDLVTKQACAAVGQSLLMDAYKMLFADCDIKIGQVLLTEEDFTAWHRYSNLRHTIDKLLQFGLVPIINENDTVSTAEIAVVGKSSRNAVFSDNDRLAALVMSGLEADALILLTNVDGLYATQPGRSRKRQENEAPTVIPLVAEITPELKSLATGPTGGGRGGMASKIEAAEIAMLCGGTAVIANGQTPGVIDRIIAGEKIGTAFLPSKRMKGKHRWIVFAAGVQGRITVDAGVQSVLTKGKTSLLATGIARIEGHFAAGDVVEIVDGKGQEFARGIAHCHSGEAAAKSRGAAKSRIVVRRDNIVLLRN